MPDHTNEWYISGLRNDEDEALKAIIEKCRPSLIRWVTQNSGSPEDGEDAFMYAIEVVYRKAKSGELQLSCAFSTYVFQVGKFWWLKQLRRKKQRVPVTGQEDEVFNTVDAESRSWLEVAERRRFLQEKLGLLGNSCQRLLQLFLQGIKLPEIAERMNIQYGTARKQKSRCIKKLRQLIREDERFFDLFE
ncbi:MAG: sigma-70 family RNA polymerase sigma factor [Phaeodactylibacter sp.]|nr:sigma-70 family RNA polymerase sigma factor [Phaeodactylibacter sp.]